MTRIFITGSADGLGYLASKHLVDEGHRVVLHARDEKRGKDALAKVPRAEAVVTGDLSIVGETIKLAEKVNELGMFDAIIQNAGVYKSTADLTFRVNTLAPYILTSLIHSPSRLIFLSSGLHLGGNPLRGIDAGQVSYSDSKLHMVMLAKIVSRKWKGVLANSVDPGWVPTKMGGPGAPGNLVKGYETQVWLAVSNDREAQLNGRYFFHKKLKHHHPDADNVEVQECFLKLCEQMCGIKFPH